MKPHSFLYFVILITISCSVDYRVETLSNNETDLIIVNGYLDAEKPINIELFKVQSSNKGSFINGLEGSRVIFKENEKVIYDDLCPDSVFTMNYYPQQGAVYGIEVSCNGFNTVKARTVIPQAIQCEPKFSTSDDYWDRSNDIVTLNHFTFHKNENASLWITSYMILENDEIIQYSEIFSSNVLVDKINSVAGTGVKNNVVGSIYYNGFLRIKNKDLSNLTEIAFTPNYVIYDNNPQLSAARKKIKVNLITASPEYDKYNKSLYEQKYMIVYDEDISSIFYQPKGVYSNIENGLGIFAGMSKISFLFDLPVSEN